MKNLQSNIDVSINITAHTEGDYLYRTLKSMDEMVAYAKKNNTFKFELNLGLDNADTRTIEVAEAFASKNKQLNIKIFRASFGDPALHRNYLVSESSGKYIMFCDGDDLVSENYLSEALNESLKHNEPAVYSVGWFLEFFELEETREVIRILPSNDANFVATNSYDHCAFLSQLFVSREIYEKIPFVAHGKHYRSEDWHWYMNVLSAGYTFYTLPETMFFYRIKHRRESLSARSDANQRLIPPTPFFEPQNFKKLNNVESGLMAKRPWVSAPPQPVVEETQQAQERSFSNIRSQLMRMPTLYTFGSHQYRSVKPLVAPLLNALRKTKPIKEIEPTEDPTEEIPVLEESIKRLDSFGLTERHLKIWKKVNEVEPLVNYGASTLINLTVRDHTPPGKTKDMYYNFCEKFDGKITDIVMVPHLVRGGGDLVVIRVVEALASRGRKVLVLADSGNDSSWAHRIDEVQGATFIDSVKDLKLDEDGLMTLLARIVQNWNIKTFTVSNSLYGYIFIDKYGDALKNHTRFLVWIYAFGLNEFGMAHQLFPLHKIYHKLERVLTDGKRFKETLIDVYGWKGKKITPVHQPIDAEITEAMPHKIKRKILYAGRINPEKLTSLLLDLAEEISKDDISLDIYGSRNEWYCDQINFDERVGRLQSLEYKGVYDSFSKLPIEEYDLMILPTFNEGMPNIVLESIKANLFVVSADVGSLSEAVESGRNGILVKNKTEMSAYLDAVREFYSSDQLQDSDARSKFNTAILERHSIDNYNKKIDKIYELN